MRLTGMHSRDAERNQASVRRTAGIRLVMLLATGLVMGCGGGEPAASDDTAAAPVGGPAAATASTNACALLPAAQITEVLGEAVRDSLALNMDNGAGTVSLSQCNYATASNPAAVSLMLRRSADAETPAGSLQSIRETMVQAGTTVEDVPGLGEGALWGGNQLHVVTNKGWSIVVTPAPSGGLAQARTIAEHAISRM